MRCSCSCSSARFFARSASHSRLRWAGGIKTSGVYGGDVPDGLCHQWAEDYFRDPDAKEDQEPESKFVPRPYVKPYTPKPSEPKPAPKPKGYVDGQISLLGEAS